jgi:DNA-binding response OmpR family regulator
MQTHGIGVDINTNRVLVGDDSVKVAPGLAEFLSVLADTPGRPIGVEALTVKLWGYDRAPLTSRNVLSVYASRARRILRPRGYDVVFAGKGYDPTLALAKVTPQVGQNESGAE